MVHLTHPLQEDEHFPGGSCELLEKKGLHQNTRLDKTKALRHQTCIKIYGQDARKTCATGFKQQKYSMVKGRHHSVTTKATQLGTPLCNCSKGYVHCSRGCGLNSCGPQRKSSKGCVLCSNRAGTRLQVTLSRSLLHWDSDKGQSEPCIVYKSKHCTSSCGKHDKADMRQLRGF